MAAHDEVAAPVAVHVACRHRVSALVVCGGRWVRKLLRRACSVKHHHASRIRAAGIVGGAAHGDVRAAIAVDVSYRNRPAAVVTCGRRWVAQFDAWIESGVCSIACEHHHASRIRCAGIVVGAAHRDVCAPVAVDITHRHRRAAAVVCSGCWVAQLDPCVEVGVRSVSCEYHHASRPCRAGIAGLTARDDVCVPVAVDVAHRHRGATGVSGAGGWVADFDACVEAGVRSIAREHDHDPLVPHSKIATGAAHGDVCASVAVDISHRHRRAAEVVGESIGMNKEASCVEAGVCDVAGQHDHAPRVRRGVVTVAAHGDVCAPVAVDIAHRNRTPTAVTCGRGGVAQLDAGVEPAVRGVACEDDHASRT